MHHTINKNKIKLVPYQIERPLSRDVEAKKLDSRKGKFLNNSPFIGESKLCLILDDNDQKRPTQVNSKWCSIEEEGPFARSTPVNLEFSSPHIKQVYLHSQGSTDDFSLKHFRYSVNEIKDNFIEIETRIDREHVRPCLDIIKDAKSLVRDVLVHSVELTTRAKVKEIIIKVT